MKKLILLFMAVLTVCSCLICAVTASAAENDFVIKDGVLLRYSGSASSVTVPDGVYSIGTSAFEGNKKLTSVTLPSTVYSVGDRAFYGCSALRSVSGTGVSSVGVMPFNGTPYFEDSSDDYLTLGSCLLWYNGSNAKASLPAGIVSIAPYAFLRCEYLTSFTAEAGLVSVGEGAFYGCSSLAAVSFPDSVSYIGAYAFDGTAYLNSASGFCVLGGVLVRYKGGDAAPAIPSGVSRIASRAFINNTALKTVSMPRTVRSIDSSAFEGCSNMSSLSLNSGLIYIGDRAFASCASLKEIHTPETLSYIGENAFTGCNGLDSISLTGYGLTVSTGAFSGCKSARWALVSSGVAKVCDNAFADCSSLEGITFASGTADISSTALTNCQKVVVFCEKNAPAVTALKGHNFSTVMGDADSDGSLTIIDATHIQRYLVGFTEFSPHDICASEIDGDGSVSVLDATRIQRILAGLI